MNNTEKVFCDICSSAYVEIKTTNNPVYYVCSMCRTNKLNDENEVLPDNVGVEEILDAWNI